MATKKKAAAKKSPAKKVTATKKAEVSVSDSVNISDRPSTQSATESGARKRENRNTVSVNTGEGYKETDVTQDAAPEAAKEVPTDSCQNVRPNGKTCLDELKDAKENPQRYTEPQQKDILAGNNLCSYCMEQE